jgi:hypothetical protein
MTKQPSPGRTRDADRVSGFLLRQRQTSHGDAERSRALQPWHWFVLTAAVPVAHCASRLNLDLWHDEIYTIDVFVRRGPRFIVSDYHLPNNHVLFSLLEWPFYCLSDSNFVLRLAPFVCAIGTLIVLFRLAWRLAGLPCAVTSTALLGLNQMFLNFAIQVRGYSLSMLLAAFLGSLAVMQPGKLVWRRWVATALVGAAFLYVLPTNVLFFLPLTAIAVGMTLANKPGKKQVAAEALAWLTAPALALLCYLPILDQIRKASASSSPSSWSYLPVIAGNFFRPATHDFLWFAPLVVLGLLAWASPRRPTQRNWGVAMLCGGVIGGACLLTGALRISPFERVYCPLLVFLALAGGWLLAELADAVRRRMAGSVESSATVALVVISLVIWPQLWTYPKRLETHRNEFNATHPWPQSDGWPIADGYYCYYAANYRPSAVVNYLLDEGIERSSYRLCWTQADHLNLWYYFDRAGLPLAHPAAPDDDRVVIAIAPMPPPWNRLAKECELSDDEIKAFRLVRDFGYYRLYQMKESP